MRKLRLLLATALIGLAPAFPALAARDALPKATEATPFELIVFEADGCVYCQVFRRDVLPLYTSSQVSREAPIRFVNVSRSDETKMGIASPITIAPTVVLMREGREVDRITGYTGPINFLRFVNIMMGRGD